MRKLATLTIACLVSLSIFAQNEMPALRHPRDKFWGSAWGWTFIAAIVIFLVAVVQSAIDQRANRQ